MRDTCAIVVTYNRVALLERCLAALREQSSPPAVIIVVDNASTDQTREVISRQLQDSAIPLIYERLSENLGGAGGFHRGLQVACTRNFSWSWMMDDDAEPHPDALAELMAIAPEPHNIYGSIAVSGDETAWLTTLLGDTSRSVDRVADIPTKAEVSMLPFLGFLIHSDLVAKIGLPDAGFFIAADDVEYCIRAQKAGAKIFVAGKSRIEHPRSRPYKIKLPGHTLTSVELPPWKRYYDTRNRLLIARKHYGSKLLTQTIPASFLRMAATLVKEPRKLAQLGAFFAGFIDGLLGRKGCRHKSWSIKQ